MDFYKISQHKESYPKGLNIPEIAYTSSGELIDTRFYIARESILFLLDSGKFISKVYFPEGIAPNKIILSPKQDFWEWRAEKIILGELELITLEVILRLISEGADYTPNYLVAWACRRNYPKVVKHFLKHENYNPLTLDSYSLSRARMKGYSEIVKLVENSS